MTKSRTHYSGQPDRGRPVRRGHRPPGRRQQQPWASPSVQTATRGPVTRTESSEPVRQQLVRVSLEAAHCLSGCILRLNLGSGGHVPPQAWSGFRTILPLCYMPQHCHQVPMAGPRPVLDMGPQPWPALGFSLHRG